MILVINQLHFQILVFSHFLNIKLIPFFYPLIFFWIDITIPAIEPINIRIDIIAKCVNNGSMTAYHVIGTPSILMIAKIILKLNAATNIYVSSPVFLSSIFIPPLNLHRRLTLSTLRACLLYSKLQICLYIQQ